MITKIEEFEEVQPGSRNSERCQNDTFTIKNNENYQSEMVKEDDEHSANPFEDEEFADISPIRGVKKNVGPLPVVGRGLTNLHIECENQNVYMQCWLFLTDIDTRALFRFLLILGTDRILSHPTQQESQIMEMRRFAKLRLSPQQEVLIVSIITRFEEYLLSQEKATMYLRLSCQSRKVLFMINLPFITYTIKKLISTDTKDTLDPTVEQYKSFQEITNYLSPNEFNLRNQGYKPIHY